MSGTRVLVAGASIAGPAPAHWLRRRGAGVTVVEWAPELRPGVQAVDARGVTREVIRRMGLDAAVRAAAGVPRLSGAECLVMKRPWPLGAPVGIAIWVIGVKLVCRGPVLE